MKRSRPLLLAGTVLPTVVVGGVGYWLVARSSPDAAFSRLWLDVGLAVFLGAIVSVLTQGPGQQVQRLVDTLRGISIGQRDRRLEPEKFGDLEDLARACNEIAAALTEHEDPNLGEVQRRRRTADEAAQKAELDESLSSGEQPQLVAALSDGAAARDWRAQQLDELSAHPDVGPVRKRKKTDAAADGQASGEDPDADDADGEDRTSAPPDAERADGGPADDGPADDEPADDEPADEASPSSSSSAADEPSTAEADPALHEAPTITPVGASAQTEVGEADPALDTNVDASVLDGAGDDAAGGATVPDMPAVGAPERALESDERPDGGASDDEPGRPRSDDSVEEEAPSEVLPGDAEDGEGDQDDPLEALFDAYVSAKKEHGESTEDLELASFVETIRDESERLREDHKCRDVRFEVRVQGGEVSLLPRLLR